MIIIIIRIQEQLKAINIVGCIYYPNNNYLVLFKLYRREIWSSYNGGRLGSGREE